MTKRILIVEDDVVLARVLRDNLVYEGFKVETVADGGVAVRAAREFAPDLVLLDIVLPGKSGLELCRLWEREELRVPVILLTARALREDKLIGLKAGADDYVTKPFDLEELIARIHAVLRRGRPAVDRLQLGRITIDFTVRQAWDGPAAIDLTYREFLLLHYFAERADTVVHRDELLREVWGYSEQLYTRAVDHAIVRLRRKIESDPHHPQFIRTVHGDGYSLTMSDAPDRPEEPGH